MTQLDLPCLATNGAGLSWDPFELIDFGCLCSYEEIKEPLRSRLDGMVASLLLLTGVYKMSDRQSGLIRKHFFNALPVSQTSSAY